MTEPIQFSGKNHMLKTTGYILLAISCLSFIAILIIPWIGFSKIQIAGITTGLIITGEVLFYLSMFILGRSFYEKLKSKLRFRKSKIKDSETAISDNSDNPGVK